MNYSKIIEDKGKGLPFILLHEAGIKYADYIGRLSGELENSRLVQIELAQIRANNWRQIVEELNEQMQKLQLRFATFISFGPAASITQYLALKYPKLLKAMILFDPTSRAHPDTLTRFIDKIESKLPLGLPLRMDSEELDTKPFLHRLRLPTLIVSTPHASQHETAEAALLQNMIPTAWSMQVDNNFGQQAGEPSGQIKSIIEFQNIPPKCSMRAKGR